jgi:biotin/methionine sulfoxide reductase
MPRNPTLTHWGAYEVETDAGEVVALHPYPGDPDPSPIGRSLTSVGRNRVHRPAVRRSWLEGGPGSAGERRGSDPFVEVEWDQARDLVAAELDRVRTRFGNEAIYGGSYGWASAGRFHHAQSQLHRFLACIGGYTASVNTYSLAAAEVIIPHVVGVDFDDLQSAQTSWPVIAVHCELFVAFGGVPLKNTQVQYGGHGRHTTRGWVETCRERGVRFVNVSPIRDDLVDTAGAEWWPVRPNTDTALMLGLLHTLVAEDLVDDALIDRYCTGWDRLRSYVMGEDGPATSAGWAAAITGLEAERIRALARAMASHRTMITVAWSVQRADHGEQPYWAAVALAAALGQVGLPGGGFGFGYGAVGTVGNGAARRPLPRLGRPPNSVADFIPVARIADMLLHPGEPFDYDGRRLVYPDIRLVYWAGGNPFHHHQDLNRLGRAWARPETVVVHEAFWNPLARRADVVLPATTMLEREDLGGAPDDDHLFWMAPAIPPVGEARDDYDILSGLAARLGSAEAFTEGRTANEWVRELYERFRESEPGAPPFDEFRRDGVLRHPPAADGSDRRVLLAEFRSDPVAHPLATPSGRIELWSATIAGFGYPDCPPHPAWLEPAEWLGGDVSRFSLHLVSNQPATRLHSQWDHGEVSRESKVGGREPIRIHPDDASARGIRTGDVVRVFNDRGACLAGAVVSGAVRPGVVQLSTGAWYDPAADGMCRHGNPNVLTRDAGTSRLAQGPTAQTCLVEVERFEGEPPRVEAFEAPPGIEARG